MTRPASCPHGSEDPSGVLGLLHAAEHYVQPSADLRPRVLEEARRERGRVAWRRQVGFAGAAVLLLSAGTLVGGGLLADRLDGASARGRVERHLTSGEVTSRGMAIDRLYWGLVEAFLATRAEQAAAFESREDGGSASPDS